MAHCLGRVDDLVLVNKTLDVLSDESSDPLLALLFVEQISQQSLVLEYFLGQDGDRRDCDSKVLGHRRLLLFVNEEHECSLYLVVQRHDSSSSSLP